MNPKLLIITDLGSLKAYQLGATPRGTPRLEPLEEIALTEAHQRVVDRVSDLAGRRAAPARNNNMAAPVGDDHNLKLETRRRLTREIAGHILRLARQHPEASLWLAAHKAINRPVCDALPNGVRERVELNLARDLVKADTRELLAVFGPLLNPVRPEARPRR